MGNIAGDTSGDMNANRNPNMVPFIDAKEKRWPGTRQRVSCFRRMCWIMLGGCERVFSLFYLLCEEVFAMHY